MGVGFATDLVVCCALGCDMFDCVFPTRTAVSIFHCTLTYSPYDNLFYFYQRFGCALVETGQLNLKLKSFAQDFRPIDDNCECSTCKRYTRAYLHTIATIEPVACNIITVHNIAYQLRLMRTIRENIKKGTFVDFIYNFMDTMYPEKNFPTWATDALKAVNVDLNDRHVSNGKQSAQS